ncbi:MAG TPA: VanZ family protein [Telluria sp.]
MTALFRTFLLAPEYRILRYRAAWLMFGVIVIGGAIPGARAEMGNVAPGVVLHASAYATITFLLLTGSAGTLAARALKAVLTVAVMGALDEGIQTLLPYRRGAVTDWVVDVTAALTCAAVCLILMRPQRG